MNPALMQELVQLTGEHLVLVFAALVIASAIAIPTGIHLARQAAWRGWLLGAANVVQTIPSLALFGFTIPLLGIGWRTAEFALILYALLPILRNTLTGMLGVDRAVLESAQAMGMTPAQILRWVELPLAAPTILAGVRIAAVATVGTATIAAAIGAGGLGVLIFRGVASVNPTLLLAGAIPAAAIALIFDGGFGWLERKVSRS
jgi:osmoprotectant transport system permease protein